MHRPIRAALRIACATTLCLSACSRRDSGAAPVRRGVLLFSFDAAAASHFGAYGYPRGTTPETDRLARDGIVFRNYFAAAPYTRASFASLYTSKYPLFHNVVRPGDVIDPKDPTLAETMRAAGFSTGAIVTNGFLSRAQGYARGFDLYVNYQTPRGAADYWDLLQEVRRFLSESSHRSFFLLVHVLLPHNPYSPPARYREGLMTARSESRLKGTELVEIDSGARALEPGDRQRLIDLYDANLRYGDFLLGEVLNALRSAGRFDSTDIVVTSDHGEAFGEHDRFLHSSTVYDEMIRIPLILHPARSRVLDPDREAIGDNVDLFPTIADLEKIPVPPGHLQGQSLLNRAHAGRKRYVLSYSTQLESVALRSRDEKYIRHRSGKEEYFDLSRDPGEKANLAPLDPGRFSRRAVLEKTQAQLANLSGVSRSTIRPLSDETVARLRELGYLAAGGSKSASASPPAGSPRRSAPPP